MPGPVVLVESHYRSRSWFLALRNIGLTHIISVMPEEFKIFKDLGFPVNNILNLYYNGKKNKNEYHLIDYFENILDIKLNSIVFMDRTLRKKKREYIDSYLIFLLNTIDEFFRNIKPQIIFMEPTWTHEILICKFAKKYNVPIVAPVKDKLLPNRFLAFKDEKHLKFYKNTKVNNSNELSLEAINSVVKDKPVQYFQKFNNRNSFDIKKIPKLYRLIKISIFNYRNPNIQSSIFNDIFIKVKSILRSKIQLFFLNFKKIDEIKEKYIFVTLHVQPEASIDVVGTKFSNQIEFIRSIANTTPDEYIILVKEHSHAIGNRQSVFYKNLQEIRNVVLLHPSEKARKAINKSSLVISNTGTSSLEACILNIPSVTATPMFYNNMMLRKAFNPFEEDVSELLKNSKKKYNTNIKQNLEKIYEGSFKGNCGDFQTDPDVLNKSNIKNLEMSFDSIIKSL